MLNLFRNMVSIEQLVDCAEETLHISPCQCSLQGAERAEGNVHLLSLLGLIFIHVQFYPPVAMNNDSNASYSICDMLPTHDAVRRLQRYTKEKARKSLASI